MFDITRPYLVIPKLIQQKTWGGSYIVDTKGIEKTAITKVPIGQSYELFSGTKLSTESVSGWYEVGEADSDRIIGANFDESNKELITLESFVQEQQEKVLGSCWQQNEGMSLLLKLTQAKGNSFQIHVKPDVKDSRWQPKSETWYFFEKGKVSCGIQTGISINNYKEACKQIETEMKKLSLAVQEVKMTIGDAREYARKIVEEINPWQFVQLIEANKGDIFDMSRGGIHHSWEEEIGNPAGNILFEVQQDKMDPISTIRAFDQGKMGNNGEVRELNIDDYFKYLDTDEKVNSGKNGGVSIGGNNLFTTKDYATDRIEINDFATDKTEQSFGHYFVKDGEIELETDGGKVVVKKGWSCFVPAMVANKVSIKALNKEVEILKTYVPKN